MNFNAPNLYGGIAAGGINLTAHGSALGMSLGGGIISGLLSVLGPGGRLASALVGPFTSMLTGVLTVAAGAAATAVGGVIAANVMAVMRARGVLNLSYASGASIGASNTATNNLAGFGISVASVPGLQRDTSLQRMIGSTFGLGGAQPGSVAELSAYRSRYQGLFNQGFMGRTMARGMESSLGYEPYREMAMLPQGLFNQQIQRSQRINSSLGMNPDEIRRAGQNMTMLNASFEQLANGALVRLGNAVMPMFIKGIDNLMNYLSRIDLGKVIETGVQVGMKALGTFMEFMVRDMPPLALRASSLVLRGFASMVEAAAFVKDAFDSAASAMNSFLQSPIGQFILKGVGAPTGTGAAPGAVASPGGSTSAALAPGGGPVVASALPAARMGMPGVPAAGDDGGGSWLTAGLRLTGLYYGAKTLFNAGKAFIPYANQMAQANQAISPLRIPFAAGMRGAPGLIGSLSRFALNPITQGVGLGLAGYEGLRHLGVLPSDAAPVGEAVVNTLGRVGFGIFGGGMDNYDRWRNESGNPVSRLFAGSPAAAAGRGRGVASAGSPGTPLSAAGVAAWARQTAGDLDKRADTYDPSGALKVLHELLDVTKKTEANTRKSADKQMSVREMLAATQQMVSRVTAYRAEDEGLATLRV